MISDFLDDADCCRPLQYLADFGHELLLVHLWGSEDREPSVEGEIELVDAESGAHVRLMVDRQACRSYTEAFDRHCAEVRRLALRNGGRYAGLGTGIPIEEAIFGPLMLIEGS